MDAHGVDPIGMAKDNQELERTFRLLNDELSSMGSAVIEGGRSVDTKAAFVAGSSAAALSFLLSNRRGLLWLVAMLLYLGSFAVAGWGLWPRWWKALEPEFMLKQLGDRDTVVSLSKLVSAKGEVIQINKELARQKTNLWAISIVLLASGTIVSMLSVFFEGKHV